MKIKITVFVLIIFFSHTAFSQSIRDEIEVGKGNQFYQHGKRLTQRQVLDITKSNAEAWQEMKRSQSNGTVGSIFDYAGGFLIGWPLGEAIAGQSPNWGMLAFGAGLAGISIPFQIASVKHARAGADLYNNSLHSTSKRKTELQMGIAKNGVGLKLKF